MVDAVQRIIVVKEIYEKSDGEDYKDVRHLYTISAIQRRMVIVARRLQQQQQQVDGKNTRAYMLLDNERQLLEQKLAIYSHSPALPQCGRSPHEVLRLTDVQPEDEDLDLPSARKNKKAHTIVLLHYVFIHHSYEELVAVRDSPRLL